MIKEIDILLRAKSKGCLIVDKESHVLLEEEELLAAQRGGPYQEEDDLLATGKRTEVSGPFPGCVQLGGASNRFNYRMVGETAHFAIFYPGDGEVPCLARKVLVPNVNVGTKSGNATPSRKPSNA
jgi:hypothetical protein